jgi:hypothetical protein
MENQVEKAFDFLCKRNPFDIEQVNYVCLLMNYQKAMGDQAIVDLAGFYMFALEHYEGDSVDHQIKSTFAHDFNDYKDKFMSPRSEGYGEYFDL